VGIPAAVVNSGLKFMQKNIELSFQQRLTLYLHKRYTSNRAYYAASTLGGLTHADQRITEDCERFSAAISDLYSHTFKVRGVGGGGRGRGREGGRGRAGATQDHAPRRAAGWAIGGYMPPVFLQQPGPCQRMKQGCWRAHRPPDSLLLVPAACAGAAAISRPCTHVQLLHSCDAGWSDIM
jgi:hypothetical protein